MLGGRKKHGLPQMDGQAHRVNLACELNGRLRASSVGCEIVQHRVGGWERAMIRNKSCKATLAATMLIRPGVLRRRTRWPSFTKTNGCNSRRRRRLQRLRGLCSRDRPLWPKHIPGHPKIIVQNMPGDGGVVQNYNVFTAARWEFGKTVAVTDGSSRDHWPA